MINIYRKCLSCFCFIICCWTPLCHTMEVKEPCTLKIKLPSIENEKICYVPLPLFCVSDTLVKYAQNAGYPIEPFYDPSVLKNAVSDYGKMLILSKQNPKKMISFLAEKNNRSKIFNSLILASLKKLEKIPTNYRPFFEKCVPGLKWHNFEPFAKNVLTFQASFPNKELLGVSAGNDISMAILNHCIEMGEISDIIRMRNTQQIIKGLLGNYSIPQRRTILLCLWETAAYLNILRGFRQSIGNLVVQNELGKSNVVGDVYKEKDGYALSYMEIPLSKK